jgi:hypothetical protein
MEYIINENCLIYPTQACTSLEPSQHTTLYHKPYKQGIATYIPMHITTSLPTDYSAKRTENLLKVMGYVILFPNSHPLILPALLFHTSTVVDKIVRDEIRVL